jgi:hypothetical protein
VGRTNRRSAIVAMIVAAAPSARAQTVIPPSQFVTHATFSVDRVSLALTTAIATIEPSRMAPGFSWLRVYFYSFPARAEDAADAALGSVASMDRRWQSKSSNPNGYNTSRAVLQATIDKDHKISQVDLSVPGYSCTVASSEPELMSFASRFALEPTHLRLVAKGSYVCDMTSFGSGKHTFAWNVDVDSPVFPAAAKGR